MRNVIEPCSLFTRKITVATGTGPESPAAQKVRWAVFTKYFMRCWWQGSDQERDVWLEQRLALFRRYCVPSILEQQDALTCWFLFAEEFLHPILRAESHRFQGNPLS